MPSKQQTRYRRAIILSTAMASAPTLARIFSPTKINRQMNVEVGRAIPKHLPHWKENTETTALIIDPGQAAFIKTVYSQTYNSTYRNINEESIMVSLAYNEYQVYENQIHKPEVCYRAQGFEITKIEHTNLQLGDRSVPVTRLIARNGDRIEPLTYWIRHGDFIVRTAFEQNAARVFYGISRGEITDGLLVRVSEISNDPHASWRRQAHFLEEAFQNASEFQREMLIGKGMTISKNSRG